MSAPYLSAVAAILYFAWLWHDRKASDRAGVRTMGRPEKESYEATKAEPLQLQPAERVIINVFDVAFVSKPIAQDASR